MLEPLQEIHRLRIKSAILRAGSRVLQQIAAERFGFIQEHRRIWPVIAMCRVLEVSPSGFYAWRARTPNQWMQRRQQLHQQIVDIFEKSRRTYGSPRIHAELVASGVSCCQKTVAKIMRRAGLQATIRRQFRRTTDSRHSLPVAENLLDRQFDPSGPNQSWVSDIMAIPTAKGWFYLVAVLDLFSRRSVGWSMGDRRTSELVITALKMALAARQPQPGLLHHSDRGSQYACHDFQDFLASHGIVCSMSRKGNCWDNAVMESFFGTLKQELLQHRQFATRNEAEPVVVEFISVFYNLHRRHSTLDYLTPAEYEARYAARDGSG